MVVRKIITDMLPSIWPMVAFISLVAITLRGCYLLSGRKRVCLYKEIMSLIFIIYILCLYFIVVRGDNNYAGVNLIPFKEILRYDFGSYKFMKNIIGNILIFVPFGYFASYYLNSKKWTTTLGVTLIITLGIESLQYYIGRVFDIDDIILNVTGSFLGYLIHIALNAVKNKLPRFMRSDLFLNILLILVLCLIFIWGFNIDILSYL